LGSIAKREEPGKTGAHCVKVPGSSRVPLVCDGLLVWDSPRREGVLEVSYLFLLAEEISGIHYDWQLSGLRIRKVDVRDVSGNVSSKVSGNVKTPFLGEIDSFR
jgi:hypothetical protein